MGRKSTLRRLPPEIRAEINRILSEGRLTLDELLEHLRRKKASRAACWWRSCAALSSITWKNA